MTNEEAIKMLVRIKERINFEVTDAQGKMDALNMAIKSLEAWGKIDDEIASLQHTYFIGTTYTEKAIWENLQAVRKTIHEYLKDVSG